MGRARGTRPELSWAAKRAPDEARRQETATSGAPDRRLVTVDGVGPEGLVGVLKIIRRHNNDVSLGEASRKLIEGESVLVFEREPRDTAEPVRAKLSALGAKVVVEQVRRPGIPSS